MEQRPHTRLNAAAPAFATNAVNSNLRRAQLSYFAAWTPGGQTDERNGHQA